MATILENFKNYSKINESVGVEKEDEKMNDDSQSMASDTFVVHSEQPLTSNHHNNKNNNIHNSQIHQTEHHHPDCPQYYYSLSHQIYPKSSTAKNAQHRNNYRNQQQQDGVNHTQTYSESSCNTANCSSSSSFFSSFFSYFINVNSSVAPPTISTLSSSSCSSLPRPPLPESSHPSSNRINKITNSQQQQFGFAFFRFTLVIFLALIGQQQYIQFQLGTVAAHSPPRTHNNIPAVSYWLNFVENNGGLSNNNNKTGSGIASNVDGTQQKLSFDRNRLMSLLNQRVNQRFHNKALQSYRNPYYKPSVEENDVKPLPPTSSSPRTQNPLLSLLSNQNKPEVSSDPYYQYQHNEQLKNFDTNQNQQQQQFPSCKQLRYLWMVKKYFNSLLSDGSDNIDNIDNKVLAELSGFVDKPIIPNVDGAVGDSSDDELNKKLVYISKIVPSRDEYNEGAMEPTGVKPLDQPAYGIVRTGPPTTGDNLVENNIESGSNLKLQHRKPTFGEFLESELSSGGSDDQHPIKPSIKLNMESRAAATAKQNIGGGNRGGNSGKSRSRFRSSKMPGNWHNKPAIPSVRIIS